MPRPLLVVSFALVALISLLALRLARSAWRSRRLPDALMSLFFLCGGPLGYGAVLARMLLADASPVLLGVLHQLGMASLNACPVAIALFTWCVFRCGDVWARTLALGLCVAVVAGFGFIQLAPLLGERTRELAAPGTAAYWLFYSAKGVCFGWAGFEASRYYRLSKRRLALGLADGLVTNRFLLWAFWSGAAAVILVARAASPFFYDITDAKAQVPLALVLIQMTAGLGCGMAVWLTFSPPRPYRRWIEGAARSARTGA